MLTIASTNPQNQQHDVYRDVIIDITFSHEIHDTSLIGEYFKLYLMPGWTGHVPCTISKIGNVIKLAPVQDLDENHEYVIWINGDKNIADETYEGVTSIVGDVLDGNKTIFFTTGTKKQSEIDVTTDIGGYDPVPGTDGVPITTPEDQQRIYEENKLLDVVRTIPKDGTSQVESLSTIRIEFDQNVSIDEGQGVSGVVSINATPFRFGEEAPIPQITDLDASDSALIISTDDNISGNTEYTITLERDNILGHNQEKLIDDFVFSINTKLSPFYSSVFLVRHRGGWLIPTSLPDSIIELYIFEASMWVVEEILLLTEYPTGAVPKIVTKLVTCKAIYDIAIGITSGKLKGIREKQLADLRIVYDKSGMDDALAKIEECIESALVALGKGKNKIGVKSGGTGLTRAYPGFKRHIHKYNIRDLTWR